MKYALLHEAQKRVIVPSDLEKAYLAIGKAELCKAVTDAQDLSATIKDDAGNEFDRTVVNEANSIEIEVITTVDIDDDIPFISKMLIKVIKKVFAPHLDVDVEVAKVDEDSGMPFIAFVITRAKP